jgi:hypothetical protein
MNATIGTIQKRRAKHTTSGPPIPSGRDVRVQTETAGLAAGEIG